MKLKQIADGRYRVLRDLDEVSEEQRIKAVKNGLDPYFMGTVHREDFTGYVRGIPIAKSFWLAHTKGYMPIVDNPFKTRREAIDALVGTTPMDTAKLAIAKSKKGKK